MKKFISVIFVIILCAFLTLTVFFFNTKSFLNTKNIKKVVEKTSITEMAKQNTDAGKELQSSLNSLYRIASDYGVSEKVVDDVIDSDVVKDFMADSIGSVSNYIMTGKDTPIISAEEFQQLFKQSVDEIMESAKIDINEVQKESFITYINENANKIVDVLPKTADVTRELDISELELMQKAFKDTVGYCLLDASALLLLFIFILRYKDKKWMWYFAVTFAISTILIISTGLFAVSFLQVLSGKIDAVVLLFAKTFLTPYVMNYVWISIILATLSILLGATYQILKFYKNKKEVTNV